METKDQEIFDLNERIQKEKFNFKLLEKKIKQLEESKNQEIENIK